MALPSPPIPLATGFFHGGVPSLAQGRAGDGSRGAWISRVLHLTHLLLELFHFFLHLVNTSVRPVLASAHLLFQFTSETTESGDEQTHASHSSSRQGARLQPVGQDLRRQGEHPSGSRSALLLGHLCSLGQRRPRPFHGGKGWGVLCSHPDPPGFVTALMVLWAKVGILVLGCAFPKDLLLWKSLRLYAHTQNQPLEVFGPMSKSKHPQGFWKRLKSVAMGILIGAAIGSGSSAILWANANEYIVNSSGHAITSNSSETLKISENVNETIK